MPSLAVIDRAAFVPSLFAGWKQSRADGSSREDFDLFNVEPPYWRNWHETFDYVLWIDFGPAPKPEIKELQLLTAGGFFGIYRVVGP